MNKQYITIAGNIGVGKSTLVELLTERLNWEPVYEAVTENPYLVDFYTDMSRWSFQSQLFFLSRRLKQHYALLQNQQHIIQDRSVYEDAEIFAKNLYVQGYMSQRDWDCYYDLYQTMCTMLQPPQLMIYLKASLPTLRQRIALRGRTYEQQIEDDYLAQLNKLYDDWAERFVLCPLLTIDTDGLNYVKYDTHLDVIWQKIEQRLYGRDYLSL